MAAEDYRVNAVNREHETSKSAPSPNRKNRRKKSPRRKKPRGPQDAAGEEIDENVEDPDDEKGQDDHTVDCYA